MSQKGMCKHFTGTAVSETCERGVNYRDHVGGADEGWSDAIPCIEHMECDRTVPCGMYEDPSDEDVAAYNARIKESVQKERERLAKPATVEGTTLSGSIIYFEERCLLRIKTAQNVCDTELVDILSDAVRLGRKYLSCGTDE